MIFITYLSIIVIIIAICVIIWYLLSKKHEKFTSVQNDYLKNMKIYVINMENQPERKEQSKDLLNKAGFVNYEFIVPTSKDEAILDPIFMNSTIPASRISGGSTVMSIFRETQEEEFIIMEDDLTFNENFTASFEDVYNAAKKVEWDLLYFEFCYDSCNNMEQVSPFLFKLYAPRCSAFIMFKKSAIKKIIDNFDINNIHDTNYADMTKNDILKSYGYPLFKQDVKLGSNYIDSIRYGTFTEDDPLCV